MSQVDVVVIGGGIAGLVAAAFLARDGREVVVLEQNEVAGGCVGGFRRQGFYFDAGAQSFESLGLVFPLLADLGLYESLAPVRADYRLRTPTVDCSLSAGYDAVEEAFCRAHPRVARSLRRFFRRLFRISRAVGELARPGRTPFLYEGSERLRALGRIALRHPVGVWSLRDAHGRYARDLVHELVDDEALADWLGSFTYRDASAFALGAFFACWQQDYWRPRLGMQKLADVLVDCCLAHGAKLRTRTAAEEILRRDGRVAGVRLAGGELLHAPWVVAACDPTHLERDLLGMSVKEPPPEEVSDSFFTLFLGLELGEEALGRWFPEQHTFLVPVHRDFRLGAEDRLGHRRRWVEVSRCSAGEPGQARPGSSSITVQTMTRVDWADWWGRGPTGVRSSRYQELKQEVAEALLDTVEQFAPALRRHISLEFAATPWTYQRYTRNLHGASAGWSWDPRRSRLRESLGADVAPGDRRRRELAGLYQCGHWTASPGSVPGSALSGWEVYRAIRRDGG